MPIRPGYVALSSGGGIFNPRLSRSLAGYEFRGLNPATWQGAHQAGQGAGAPLRGLPVTTGGAVRRGYQAEGFLQDFYYRIYVIPRSIALDNLVTAQVREIRIWNAWPNMSRVLSATPVSGGSGMDVTSPSPLPVTFRPLEEKVFELRVDTAGAPVIDAVLTFEFAGLEGIPVTITGRRLQAWPLPADWGSNIEEELSWLTEIQQAVDGSEDSEPLRAAPRRQWEFDIVADRRERRVVENAVYDWAARVWALPVMPDRGALDAPLPAASVAIPLDHAHLDYAAGGLALLWSDLQRYELVEIETVAPGVLGLVRPTLQAWPAGTRVYPCRAARLTEAPTWRRKSDQVITSRVRFEASEPCDWPEVAPPAMYRGYPVLEWRGDESDDPTAASLRAVEILDGDIGLVSVDDITGRTWAQQTHDFVLYGRAERAAHRSVLYWLAGRYQRLWVPTFADDVQLLEPLGAGVSTLFVAGAGIAAHLRQQPGRRHLRIERYDGTVDYREVLSSSEIDGDRELLLIDDPLAAALDPGQVRVISWMALSRQASDRVGITHVNASEGLARSRLSFVTVGAHEP